MSNDKHQPHKYLTKILLLPHVRGVICGTGSADLLLKWYLAIQCEILVPDLAWLAAHTPRRLAELAEQIALPGEMETTIYHFGWDHRANRMVGQSFAASEGFQLRDAHRESLVIKPGYALAVQGAGELVFQDGVAGFAEIMRRQREAEERLSTEERTGIGGEVHFIEIAPNQIGQLLAYRFSDYQELYDLMSRRAQRFPIPSESTTAAAASRPDPDGVL